MSETVVSSLSNYSISDESSRNDHVGHLSKRIRILRKAGISKGHARERDVSASDQLFVIYVLLHDPYVIPC